MTYADAGRERLGLDLSELGEQVEHDGSLSCTPGTLHLRYAGGHVLKSGEEGMLRGIDAQGEAGELSIGKAGEEIKV